MSDLATGAGHFWLPRPAFRTGFDRVGYVPAIVRRRLLMLDRKRFLILDRLQVRIGNLRFRLRFQLQFNHGHERKYPIAMTTAGHAATSPPTTARPRRGNRLRRQRLTTQYHAGQCGSVGLLLWPSHDLGIAATATRTFRARAKFGSDHRFPFCAANHPPGPGNGLAGVACFGGPSILRPRMFAATSAMYDASRK